MPKPSRTLLVATLAAAAVLSSPAAQAQSASAVKTAVQKALQINPELSAKLNAFKAQTDAVDAAAAGWKPRLDLNVEGGATMSKYQGESGSSTVKRAGAGLTLSQVLWDGMGTRNEVARASHQRLARWFEFVDASEQTALEATRGLYDLQRQRRLVQLADDNVAQHRNAAAKIEQRAKAGVGRGVDLDQVRARLALAESNLETELANLHDVAARYQRIVGDVPSGDAGALEPLAQGLPVSPTDAVQSAVSRNPAIAASIETMRAARAGEDVRKSALQPKVEARARVGAGRNYGGVVSRNADAGVEVVMNWNLYDGGADRARVNEQHNLLGQATDQRDKACRDVRQTALIAYNDALKLGSQISMLDRNTGAIERAREAYRQQFDIGQRSLLDLLNAENEAYTARRALVNAEYDRAVAHARVHAATSQLNVQLGIARDALPGDVKSWAAGEDGAGRCPAQALDMGTLRGAAAGAANPAAPARLAAAGAGSAVATATAAAVALPVKDSAATLAPLGAAGSAQATLNAAITAQVDAWAKAQRGKDFEGYAALYSPDFSGEEPTPPQWRMKQAKQFAQWSAKKAAVGVKVAGLQATELPDGQVETRFRQTFTSPGYKEVGDKVLTWKISGGQWRIAKETSL